METIHHMGMYDMMAESQQFHAEEKQAGITELVSSLNREALSLKCVVGIHFLMVFRGFVTVYSSC